MATNASDATTPGSDRQAVIVVGIDGSPQSLDALAWARSSLGETAEIHVVIGGDQDITDAGLRAVEQAATTGVHRSSLDPADSMVSRAEAIGAELIVVGARGHTHRLPGFVGGVTLKTVRLSPCPVVVVGSSGADDAGSPLVVGVGDGDATRAAVRWAAKWALRHERPVQLFRAVDPMPIFGLDNPFDVLASYIEPDQLLTWAADELDRIGNTVTDAGVSVTTTADFGPAHRLLVDASAGASLLVIGKHYDGPITGFLISRTLNAALLGAQCPVVVVPDDETTIPGTDGPDR